jgi:hypothetical protein
MPDFCNPRLSQARSLLACLRTHLSDVASHYSLPANLALDLLPIIEDGLFGYEILPTRDTHTYLTIGADADDSPVVRKTLYCATSPSALRLAAANGRTLLRHELDAWRNIVQSDTRHADWTTCAAATWAELSALFAERPRFPISIHDAEHAALDDALATAQSYLNGRDPRIDFCGIPDEAQYGFVLTGDDGEHGHIVLRSRGLWELQWSAPTALTHEEWKAHPFFETIGVWAYAGEPEHGAANSPPAGIRRDRGARR